MPMRILSPPDPWRPIHPPPPSYCPSSSWRSSPSSAVATMAAGRASSRHPSSLSRPSYSPTQDAPLHMGRDRPGDRRRRRCRRILRHFAMTSRRPSAICGRHPPRTVAKASTQCSVVRSFLRFGLVRYFVFIRAPPVISHRLVSIHLPSAPLLRPLQFFAKNGRRTTATTIAGFSAVAEATSEEAAAVVSGGSSFSSSSSSSCAGYSRRGGRRRVGSTGRNCEPRGRNCASSRNTRAPRPNAHRTRYDDAAVSVGQGRVDAGHDRVRPSRGGGRTSSHSLAPSTSAMLGPRIGTTSSARRR